MSTYRPTLRQVPATHAVICHTMPEMKFPQPTRLLAERGRPFTLSGLPCPYCPCCCFCNHFTTVSASLSRVSLLAVTVAASTRSSKLPEIGLVGFCCTWCPSPATFISSLTALSPSRLSSPSPFATNTVPSLFSPPSLNASSNAARTLRAAQFRTTDFEHCAFGIFSIDHDRPCPDGGDLRSRSSTLRSSGSFSLVEPLRKGD